MTSRSLHGAVAGGHPLEVEAGLEMLRLGGNAIDAVVAAAFAGFVVEPASCGIGGYGHLSLRIGATGEMLSVDHYVRAPAAARADMFAIDETKPLKYYGFPHTVGMKAERGHLAPAVPGAVAGMCEAHARFGRLPLARVLEPAIAAAETGVPVTWSLLLVIAPLLDEIRSLPHTAAFLLRDGKLPRIAGQISDGDRLDCRELAATLRLIAAKGAAGFHDGPVAAAIERECKAHGGILTAADLAAYKPRWLRERPLAYRDHRYITCFDQVGYEALNILARFDLRAQGRDAVATRHLMAEAQACAFADSMTHYGDPDFERSPVAGLASPGFAEERARAIRLERALPRPVGAADPWPYDRQGPAPERLPPGPSSAKIDGTSQMVAVDEEGNVASLITSLTSGFGSLVQVPGTGVFLNNSMQNFDPRPGFANSIKPGKMPIFAAPALVSATDDGRLFAAAGSGGYRIVSGVLHAFVHHVDFDDAPQAAIDRPRVHCQGQETYIDARLPAAIGERLAELGHKVIVQREDPGLNPFGRVCAVAIDARGGFAAGAGPSWGAAAGTR
ncbi:MAG: gamma-glutamyltransferase [Alphaproteobacteria bacterium]|nr:gamma-glutamyltransferase [Alphaproteobacteria bacterium]